MVFDGSVTPICLPSETESRRQPGDKCHVAGWGRLADTGATAKTLQELEVGIIDNKDCMSKQSYGKWSGYPVIDDHMFCAGFMEGGKDACAGDSGGPLMCRDLSLINKPK